MTEPAPIEPSWLRPDHVRAWLRLPADLDADLLAACSAAVEPQVQRYRPDQWIVTITAEGETRVYQPDPEVYQAGVMLAARLYRRRNSAAGIETFADSILYVAKYDPEIERALRSGSWRRAVIG